MERRRLVRAVGHSLLLVEGARGCWAFLCECGHVQRHFFTKSSAHSAHRDHKMGAMVDA